MPNTVNVQNNFIGGLKTEFTGLNFPENAATDTDNCIYTLIGDVTRREGIDYELNFVKNTLDRANKAVVTYKWNNAGGDGSSQVIVKQVGSVIYFYLSSYATSAVPLSTTKLAIAIDLMGYLPGGSSFTTSAVAASECQFATGNGYLFVFHPYLDPFYCAFTPGPPATATITPTVITVNIRDFDGLNSDAAGLYSNTRPATLPADHLYNLANQGWDLTKANTFQAAAGLYPSNADVWWRFKNSSNVYNPATTLANVILAGVAPKGSKILNAFNQVRIDPTAVSITFLRPKTGTWFQGRVWYSGVDSVSSGVHTFSETIYFSQIITTTDQFGFCYQTNDPTDEGLFDILPTDGGVIKIQDCGSIYKLFPIQNGLLVFAANGIWFITGSQGIGFSATDYTVTKISAVQNIGGSSFINVLGYPMFWNEEGIYTVAPDPKGSGLLVENLCIGTILDYFSQIPLQSKKFARGDYNPIDFTVQWTFRSTNEANVTTRYEYDKILNFNTANKAFFPYSVSGVPKINGVIYVASPGGSTAPAPVFKYIVSASNTGVYQFSFAEERDSTNWVDWFQQDNTGVSYTSYFVTGFRIAGKALTKWQPQYVYMFLRNESPSAYKIQGIWDFAGSGDSGRISNMQTVTNTDYNFKMLFRRHRIRGHGLVLQLKVSSVDRLPFDIMGWSSLEQTNQGT